MTIPLTIRELQTDLIEKKYSAEKLVSNYLNLIEKNDSKINSFITTTPDLAFDEAKRVDEIINLKGESSLKEYPLLGCVVGLKDIFMTKGIRTTAAAKVLESYIPQYDATVVKKLKKAGAIIIGKTNMDAWAHGSSGENSDFGACVNPWNDEYVAGGSSSGSASAVACNFATFTTGTDTCGSIRLPANFCGVCGFKPTYGRVSRYGIVAMASSLDSIGHFTRTVEDAKIIFEVTKGLDGKDSTLKEQDTKNSKEKYTIGIPKEFFSEGLSKEVEDNVNEAIKVFEKMGHTIKEVSLPHTKYGISVYYIIQPAEVSSNLGRFDGVRFGHDRRYFSDEAKRRIMLGSYVLSAGYYDAYYLKAMKVRSVIIKELNEVYEDVDALIAPVSPTKAFRLGEKTQDPLKMYLSDIYAATANLSGTCGISIPFNESNDGIPLGFQLMAQRFSDDIIFDLGEKFQKEIGYKPKVVEF